MSIADLEKFRYPKVTQHLSGYSDEIRSAILDLCRENEKPFLEYYERGSGDASAPDTMNFDRVFNTVYNSTLFRVDYKVAYNLCRDVREMPMRCYYKFAVTSVCIQEIGEAQKLNSRITKRKRSLDV